MNRIAATLVALLLALLCLGSHDVLPPSAAQGFQRLLHLVNDQHRLGDRVRIENVSIRGKRVVIAMQTPDGAQRSVTLVRRGSAGQGPESRAFALQYDASAWEGQTALLKPLCALLDEAFPSSPWIRPAEQVRGRNDLPKTLALLLFAALLAACVVTAGWVLRM